MRCMGNPADRRFSHPMAFNCVFHESFETGGHSEEEAKIISETRRILDLPKLRIAGRRRVFRWSTRIRPPCLSRRGAPCLRTGARRFWRNPGIRVEDVPPASVIPRRFWPEAPRGLGRADPKDPSVRDGLIFWLSCDNLRKGAALNAIQIAEEMFRRSVVAPQTGALLGESQLLAHRSPRRGRFPR